MFWVKQVRLWTLVCTWCNAFRARPCPTYTVYQPWIYNHGTIRHHLIMKTASYPALPTNTPLLGTVRHRSHCTKYTPDSIAWLASPRTLLLIEVISILLQSNFIDVEYIYGFVWWGVCKQSRWRHSVTEPHTRWRICVTMATLWQQQDGGYMLLWKRYVNNKMAAMRYSTSSTVQS